MSDFGTNSPSAASPRLARLRAAILALIAFSAVTGSFFLYRFAVHARATYVPAIQRAQHVPAPAAYIELANPFLDPKFCVVLEEVGPDRDSVRTIVRSAAENRTDDWAGRLLDELPRLVAESVSRERAVELTAAITGAGGKASAGDAINYFVERVARDHETPVGRLSEILDDAFLRTNNDAVADLRARLARGGPAEVNRESAKSAFVAFTTAEGRALYQVNCRPCHGTKGSGDGPTAAGWSLRPVDFRATDTLAALTPGEVLWRIEEGAAGLPDEATPWDSSMPAWKHELDRELVWKIILGEFSTANVQPRTTTAHDHSRHAKSSGSPDAASPRPPEKSWLDWPVPPKPPAENSRDPEFIRRGKYLYYFRCMPCHGVAGRGDGPAANTMWPRPRDFSDIKVEGFDERMPPKFKFRTTRYGWLPTDQDLFRTISRGLAGTAMEGWAGVLEPNEIWQIVAHIKSFSNAWNDPEHIAKNPNDPVVVKEYTEPGSPGPLIDFAAMEAPTVTPQLLADGADAFRKIGCWQCHGVEARGDGSALGQHYDVWGYRAWPQNLANPANFKAGHSIKEIYRDITAGLDGSVMPTVPTESLAPKDAVRGDYLRWALAAYVSSSVETAAADKSRHAESAGVVIARRANGDLPTDPNDSRWNAVPAAHVPLSGQVIVPPRWPAPSANQMTIKALYSDGIAGAGSLAIWLRWDDRRPNLSHDEPPPDLEPADSESLGPKTYRFPALKPKAPVVFACRDQLELQWPSGASSDTRRPHVLYGDARHPVVLWRWLADRQGLSVTKELVKIENSQAERLVCSPTSETDAATDKAVVELLGRGPTVEPTPLGDGPRVRSSARWTNGSWTVVLTRELATARESDVAFRGLGGDKPDSLVPVVPFAVHVRDGLAGESGLQMATSSWVYLVLQQSSAWTHMYIAVGGVLALIAVIGYIIWSRRQPQSLDRQPRSHGR